MIQTRVGICLLFISLTMGISTAWARDCQVEKKILKYIASDEFSAFRSDQRCRGAGNYRVYLIDNFEQTLFIIPEVKTSHGEVLERLLRSGRKDISIIALNTSLSKGLARVIGELADGGCADAVVSSIPGSNCTYEQISSLFFNRVQLNSENILQYRPQLKQMMKDIALHGFPSVAWLEQADVNSSKLKNEEMVLTAGQYRTVRRLCPDALPDTSESYVWLNSTRHGRIYAFEAQCRKRGTISGTSVIPPSKMKEMLPPKAIHDD